MCGTVKVKDDSGVNIHVLGTPMGTVNSFKCLWQATTLLEYE